MQPRYLLRLEGLVVFAAATTIYFVDGGSWLLFLVLFLAPDVSMVGYVVDARIGAMAYDVVHTALLPAVLLAGTWYVGWPLGVGLALIWLAHLGADRAVGYGLKYPDADFSETHLQRV